MLPMIIKAFPLFFAENFQKYWLTLEPVTFLLISSIAPKIRLNDKKTKNRGKTLNINANSIGNIIMATNKIVIGYTQLPSLRSA